MISFYLHNSGSIYIRYYHHSTPNAIKVSTKIKIDSDKWDKNKQKAKSSKLTYKGKQINAEIKRHENAFEKAVQFYEQHRGFSQGNVRRKYLEYLSPGLIHLSTREKQDFLKYFNSLVEKYKATGQDIHKEYSTTLNHLKECFKGRELLFDDIDSAFYKEYNEYLQGIGLAKNTISKHWKHIKAVMNDAYMLKHHKNDDFKHFKRQREDSDTIFLTINKIERIYNLKLSGNIEIVRDYFIIGCYTGLRFSDWDKVKNENIKDGHFEILTDKTGERSIIPIHPKVKAILKKYQGVLPKKLSQQKTNEKLKAIGLMSKINDEVTRRITKGITPVTTTTKKYKLISTHTARRSFATNLILNGVSTRLAMKMTGHRSLVTFEKYVRIDNLLASSELEKLSFFK